MDDPYLGRVQLYGNVVGREGRLPDLWSGV
jgi:hypothetical protein